MFRYLLLFLACMQISYADKQASKLYGSWKSDAVATKAYLDKHALMDDLQKKAHPMFFGNMTVTFNSDGTGIAKCKAFSMPSKDGKEIEFKAYETKFTFKILGETSEQIVIKTSYPELIFPELPFALLKFEDANNYSISISDGISDINGREFFKRIVTEPKDKSNTEPPAIDPELKPDSKDKTQK